MPYYIMIIQSGKKEKLEIKVKTAKRNEIKANEFLMNENRFIHISNLGIKYCYKTEYQS